MNWLSAAFGIVSPAGTAARLPVMNFHRVLSSPDPLRLGDPDVERFDQMLAWIQAWLTILPLDDAVRRLRAGTLPARAAAITFDDGYADNHDFALPILRQRGLAATFFIATDYLDGGCMWNDQIIAAIRKCAYDAIDLDSLGLGRHSLATAEDRSRTINSLLPRVKYLASAERENIARSILKLARVACPHDQMLTTAKLRTLRAAGMQIGAHTASHPILAKLELDAVRREMVTSKATLEEKLQAPVELFAYPNGKPAIDYRAEHATAARDTGFIAAFSTGRGTARGTTDFMQMPRFTPWDRTRQRFGVRMFANCLRSSEHA